MRVAVNRITALRHKTGIGNYTDQLLAGFARLAPHDRFLAFPGPWTSAALQFGKRMRAGNGGPSSRSRWQTWKSRLSRNLAHVQFRLFDALHSYDLYHEPNFIPYPSRKPTIATIHDLSVMLHPQWHPPERVDFYRKHLDRALEQCQHFIAVSQFTRDEACKHLGIPAGQITCVLNGFPRPLRLASSEAAQQQRNAWGLPKSYLLYVGTLEPRKNLSMLLRAYGALPASLREKTPLVLAGGWGWNVEELYREFHDTARHRNVIHLGYVPDDRLAALYQGARALVYPSHYEGFGLPVLEMLAMGGAVLCSTAGALVELVGRDGIFVEPGDEAGWREALELLMTDEDWLARMRPPHAELYRGLTWEQTAAQTLDVYRRVLGFAEVESSAVTASIPYKLPR